jgi:hypothetical protein
MAERIIIEATRSSPAVDCNPETGSITLDGESYPENTFEFYRPVIAWLNERLASGGDSSLALDVRLSYLNTGSIKSLMDMLDRMDEAHEEGAAVSVVWHCDKDNERLVELVEELLEDISLPCRIEEV